MFEEGAAGSKHVEKPISEGKRKQAQGTSEFQESVAERYKQDLQVFWSQVFDKEGTVKAAEVVNLWSR